MSTQIPLGSFTVSSRLRRATSVRRALQTTPSANLPLIFITLESSQWIVFNSPPTVSVTLPVSVPVNGENFYLSVFENGSTSMGGPNTLPPPAPVIVNPGFPANPPEGVDAWIPYVGPVSAQGGSAAFADTAGTFGLLPNQPVYLAVFQSGIAQLNLSLSAPLVMGTASTPSLEVSALDQLGGTVQGALPEPMTFTTTETAGRASLGGTSITNLSQTIPVTYDGDADQFGVTATLGGLTGTLEATTLLPPELLLTTPSSSPNLLGTIVIGSDGNIWSTIGALTTNNFPTTEIAKVTTAGVLTQIADPNSAHSLTADIVEGGDGNVWVPYGDYTDGAGLDQVTPSGTLTSFTLSASLNGQIIGAAAAPDGSVWTVVRAYGSSSSSTVYDVERTTSTGTTTQIGTLANSPSNLLFGPDKNLWFAIQNGVGKITPAGIVSTYTLPAAATAYSSPNLTFIVGSDGNFWAPYPLGALTLLKFSTSGTVVSNAALTYSPLGTAHSQGPAAGALAVDSNGNIYAGDASDEGIIRITPSGTVAEYPTYSFGHAYFAPLEIAVDSSNKLYVADEAWQATGSNAAPGLTVVGPTLW